MIPTKTLIIAFVVFALLVAGVWWYDRAYLGGQLTSDNPEYRAVYEDKRYGILLDYRQEPNGYVVIPQKESGTVLLALSLFRRSDDEAMRAGKFGQEGPPGIRLQVFNNAKNDLPWNWVTSNSRSNYNLSANKKLTPRSVSDRPAVSYAWSGLYEGESVAVTHNKRIYLFSVTFANPADTIRGDFEDLLARVRLY